ncbi:hypothetical protein [Engelhardtia mirabilis]
MPVQQARARATLAQLDPLVLIVQEATSLEGLVRHLDHAPFPDSPDSRVLASASREWLEWVSDVVGAPPDDGPRWSLRGAVSSGVRIAEHAIEEIRGERRQPAGRFYAGILILGGAIGGGLFGGLWAGGMLMAPDPSPTPHAASLSPDPELQRQVEFLAEEVRVLRFRMEAIAEVARAQTGVRTFDLGQE